MKKKFSLRVQLLFVMFAFVIAVLGLVYIFQTGFLDTFYKNNKIKSIQNVGRDIAENINTDDFSDYIEKTSMSNEVCIRTVSNNESYSYTGACTLRGLDNNLIDLIATETQSSDNSEKLFDDFKYQRRFDEKPEDVYIFSKLITIDDELILILVSSGITPLDATISTIRSQYLVIIAIVAIMTMILTMIISTFILNPIKRINEESKNLSKGEYKADNIKAGSKEIDELNNSLENANEDILKAEVAKKELLGNVSHDLRTPLTMIVGYGEMIRDLPEENTEENINVIIDEAKRLSTLVDDLIDISKIESIKLELNREDISLNDLLTSVYHQYDKYCKSQSVDFKLELTDDITINVDTKRIKQVLYNFINNSLNHNTKDNKEIILGCNKIDNVYRVFVYDNGEGIDEKDISNIWDRYYKVDKEHKRYHIGSGIGLSLAKQLLEAHGLEYGVESKLKEYTKFYFDIKMN